MALVVRNHVVGGMNVGFDLPSGKIPLEEGMATYSSMENLVEGHDGPLDPWDHQTPLKQS